MRVSFEKVTPTLAKVTGIYYDAATMPPLDENSVYVTDVPEHPAMQRGKDTVMLIDPTTSNIWYSFVDRPLRPEERLEEMAAQNAQIILTLVMNDLM